MTTIHSLSRADLESILAAVMAYNGQTAGEIGFTDAAGQVVDVVGVHVACVPAPLRVRQVPEEPGQTQTLEDRVRQFSHDQAALFDPRRVEPPASLHQLAALAVEHGG